MAAQEEEREEGDGEVDGAEMETDYYVGRCCRKNNTLGTEPNAPLAYASVSELHHPTMSTIWGHGGLLEIDR